MKIEITLWDKVNDNLHLKLTTEKEVEVKKNGRIDIFGKVQIKEGFQEREDGVLYVVAMFYNKEKQICDRIKSDPIYDLEIAEGSSFEIVKIMDKDEEISKAELHVKFEYY